MRFAWLCCVALIFALMAHAGKPELRWQRADAPAEPVLRSSSKLIAQVIAAQKSAAVADASWTLSGSPKQWADLVVWSPFYGIVRDPAGATATGAIGASRYTCQVSLPWEKTEASAFTYIKNLWPRLDPANALLIFAWWSDGRASQVAAVPLWTLAKNGREPARVRFHLDAAEALGRPIVLLLTPDGWATPRAQMKAKVQPVYEAMMGGDLPTLRAALDAGLNPLASDPDGIPLLTFAAEAGLTDAVELLAAHIRPEERARLSGGSNAAIWAANNGRTAAVAAMLRAGLEFEDNGAWTRQPLRVAIRNGHTDTVRLLAPRVPTQLVRYYLAMALAQGDLDLVEILFAAHPDTALNARELAAALYSRVRAGDAPAVAWLLAHGARPEREDVIQGSIDLGDMSRPLGKKRDQLWFQGSGRLRLDRVRYAITRRSAGDESPLIAAVRQQSLAMLGSLLGANLDPELANAEQETALIVAARGGWADGVEALLAAGAKTNPRDAAGWSALDYAARCDNRAICERLLDHGADPLQAAIDGETPLVLAWRHGGIESARWLLQRAPAALVAGEWIPALIERALAADAADLLAAVGAVAPHELVSVGALDLARMLGAERCVAWLIARGEASMGVELARARELERSVRPEKQVAPIDPRVDRVVYARADLRISCLVDPKGRVRVPRVEGTTDGALVAAALRAVEQWKFAPARRAGTPAWVQVVIPMGFKELDFRERGICEVDVAPIYRFNAYDPALTGGGTVLLEFSVGATGLASDFAVLQADDLDYAAALCVQVGIADFQAAQKDRASVASRWLYRWE